MNKCIICGKNQFTALYDETLKRCNDCGFITANIDISEDILRATYNVNYFMGEEYMDYVRDKEVLQLNFEKRISLIKKFTTDQPAISNCLEIGCAYGFFGEILLRHFQTAYQGIDVVEEAVAWGRENLGLNLMAGDYLEQPSPQIPWTDVFIWDVIEHLKDPDRFLLKIFNEMTGGGRIYLTTGDIGAVLPRLQKSNWRMIHPPSHIHYFNRKTLSMLLLKTGFTGVNIKYPPVYRSVRQIYYSLFLLNKTGKFSSKLFNLIPAQWHIPVNTFDIMCIMATKR